ncbi:MAG: endonuclease III domain-containing protein [Candidatus Caldatribacteriaceae bacterium]
MEIEKILTILQKEQSKWQDDTLNVLDKNPFFILVGGVLSHRTKDTTTKGVLQRLLQVAPSPQSLLKIPEEELARIIYPIGFYRRKATILRRIAKILVEQYHGRVPETLEELLLLPGVGRKTANLVLAVAFGKPAICVDTHVHRIVNRWGYVQTRTPEETEKALQEKLPLPYWIPLNHLLVVFGQNVCLPRKPRCPDCPIEESCPKIGVHRQGPG